MVGCASGEILKDANLLGRITFISHAPTAAVRRAAFPLDEPVEQSELEKLRSVGWLPPRARQVHTGPEQRTRQTADALGLESIPVGELKDLDYGSWKGRSLDEVQSIDPDGVGRWLTDVHAAPHGGESIANLLERVEGWLAGRQHAEHSVAVTHPGVIRAAIVLGLGAPAHSFWRIDIAPLSITDLRWSGSHWKLRNSRSLFFRTTDRDTDGAC